MNLSKSDTSLNTIPGECLLVELDYKNIVVRSYGIQLSTRVYSSFSNFLKPESIKDGREGDSVG